MRMIYENMETRFMPDILDKKLLAIPMPGVVKDQTRKILDNELRGFFGNSDCPLELTDEDSKTKSYKEFKEIFKSDNSLFPPDKERGTQFYEPRVFRRLMEKLGGMKVQYDDATRKYVGVVRKLAEADA